MKEDRLSRRDFLKRLGRVAAATAALVYAPRIAAGEKGTDARPRLAVTIGGTPEAMFDRGIAGMGGMSRFVGRGRTVLIKPNMSWNSPPEVGATTNPHLVKRIVEHCIEAGARRVYVVDHTLDSWRLAWATTRIEPLAREAGAQVIPGNSQGYYHEVDVRGGIRLRRVRVHEMYLQADVVINVPILKHHGSTGITAALKNLMGVVWDRGFYHVNDLHQCIADFPLVRRPDLNVVDADLVMMSGGPRGTSYRATLAVKQTQIISVDIVAADAAAAFTWGTTPAQVVHVGRAEALGHGSSALGGPDILRIRM